jgi:hypothetical protein
MEITRPCALLPFYATSLWICKVHWCKYEIYSILGITENYRVERVKQKNSPTKHGILRNKIMTKVYLYYSLCPGVLVPQ